MRALPATAPACDDVQAADHHSRLPTAGGRVKITDIQIVPFRWKVDRYRAATPLPQSRSDADGPEDRHG